MAVRVRGLRETTAAFRKIDRQLPKLVTDELKKAADPVVDAGRAKIGRYRGAKLSSIRPRVKGRGSVFVQQHARKKTGRRGDYGLLQQRRLEEALDENEAKVVREVEDALDRITRGAGF